MRFVIFTHSLRSCWNHGNAHFLRGICRDLSRRGHRAIVYEPEGSWSSENLIAERGREALDGYKSAYPELDPIVYPREGFDLDAATDGADVVLVHEWNDHALVRDLGLLRKRGAPWKLLFHDTHHRSVTDRASMAAYDLSAYDGVLAFGEVIRELYVREGWSKRAWTFHEAADTTVFAPSPLRQRRGTDQGDAVWIGNWGDEERTRELQEFLIDPVRDLGLRATIHGVRYPDHALAKLREANIDYRGWLPNYEAPRVFGEYAFTVHVPRGPYARSLPGIPTIRVFEALASGIPLLSAPWRDSEGLFRAGDYLIANDGEQMRRHMRALVNDDALRNALVDNGLETIRARHTCSHRVDQLLEIVRELGDDAPHAQGAIAS